MLQAETALLQRKELELTVQIEDLSETLVSVRSMLSAARARASECMERFSPVARLPDETLLAIFLETVLCQDVGSRIRAESAVSCVSRRWRRIALHTARLWTRVCVTPDMDERGLRLHLLRSAALPLCVEIWGWDDRDSFIRPRHFERTLSAAIPSTSRWRCVAIGMLCDSLLTFLSFVLHTVRSFGTLQQVIFKAQRPGQMCPPTFLVGDLAPNLRSVDVENVALILGPYRIRRHDSESFVCLTHLTLRLHEEDARALKTMRELQAFRALLVQMPNLISLSLYGEPVCFKPVASPEDGGDTIITLPRLQTLIMHTKPRCMRNLIAMIMVPDLRHFEFVCLDGSTEGLDISDLLVEEEHGLSTPKFPLVEHLVLNDAARAATCVQAFPRLKRSTSFAPL